MGIFTGEKQLSYSFVQGIRASLQMRASPKNKFWLCGVHLNPHSKCHSSKFNLKLFKKRKNGGHLKPGNRLIMFRYILTIGVKHSLSDLLALVCGV